MSNHSSVIETNDYTHTLQTCPTGGADLLLTDPPYHISRKTGFAALGPKSIERYAVSMDFDEAKYPPIDLDDMARRAYCALRTGGTAIIFYDLWKLTLLAASLADAGFVQFRFIEWLKTNPVPLNSKRNYLTNSREIAISAVKVGKPTFHSTYDNGLYQYPIAREKGAGNRRYHPTQKPLPLFKDLIKKHSNPGDLVIDPFLGSGTTALAALEQERAFYGGDIDPEHTKIAKERVARARIASQPLPAVAA